MLNCQNKVFWSKTRESVLDVTKSCAIEESLEQSLCLWAVTCLILCPTGSFYRIAQHFIQKYFLKYAFLLEWEKHSLSYIKSGKIHCLLTIVWKCKGKLTPLQSHTVNSPVTVVKHCNKEGSQALCCTAWWWQGYFNNPPFNKSSSRHACQNQAGTPHLQSNVQVQKANGAPFSQLILLLCATHLHDAQRLGLGRQCLHTQGL